ncbi:hypothetical protein Poly41_60040 [Novipirellula artificiosorum]|uniref:Uncharacterized protein n=1 Tax=Novipirellula artificiosorum TaxID=2528016 RepID=A0A5C6DAA5_9BACT|nr:hypothetical protein Poly41_60040 [Novipirellula artificiosorum]
MLRDVDFISDANGIKGGSPGALQAGPRKTPPQWHAYAFLEDGFACEAPLNLLGHHVR